MGLETLRSPLCVLQWKKGRVDCADCLSSVYCSAATRALVLRLERYPCRLNHAKGILEARRRTYAGLKPLLVRMARIDDGRAD